MFRLDFKRMDVVGNIHHNKVVFRKKKVHSEEEAHRSSAYIRRVVMNDVRVVGYPNNSDYTTKRSATELHYQ